VNDLQRALPGSFAHPELDILATARFYVSVIRDGPQRFSTGDAVPRDFNDAQGQRWTARQVGVVLEAEDTSPASAMGNAPQRDDSPAEIEFRAAMGATVYGMLTAGELYRVSEESLREALEKALGNQHSGRGGDQDGREFTA
jgi:hypothetical protein